MPVRPFVYFYSDSENFDENLRVYYGIGGPAKVVFFSYLQFVTRMWLCNELEVGESNEIPVINGRNANLKYRCVFIYIYIYRVYQEECARLREIVPYVKLYRYNPKHIYPKLNGYGDNGHRSLKF